MHGSLEQRLFRTAGTQDRRSGRTHHAGPSASQALLPVAGIQRRLGESFQARRPAGHPAPLCCPSIRSTRPPATLGQADGAVDEVGDFLTQSDVAQQSMSISNDAIPPELPSAHGPTTSARRVQSVIPPAPLFDPPAPQHANTAVLGWLRLCIRDRALRARDRHRLHRLWQRTLTKRRNEQHRTRSCRGTEARRHGGTAAAGTACRGTGHWALWCRLNTRMTSRARRLECGTRTAVQHVQDGCDDIGGRGGGAEGHEGRHGALVTLRAAESHAGDGEGDVRTGSAARRSLLCACCSPSSRRPS